MMIHQQPPLLPPQEPLHIIVTSEFGFVTACAVHSMLFRRAKKVRRKGRIQIGKIFKRIVNLHKTGIFQLSIVTIVSKE